MNMGDEKQTNRQASHKSSPPEKFATVGHKNHHTVVIKPEYPMHTVRRTDTKTCQHRRVVPAAQRPKTWGGNTHRHTGEGKHTPTASLHAGKKTQPGTPDELQMKTRQGAGWGKGGSNSLKMRCRGFTTKNPNTKKKKRNKYLNTHTHKNGRGWGGGTHSTA